MIAAGRKLDRGDYGLLELEAELLDASGRGEEALEIWQTFKQAVTPKVFPECPLASAARR